MLQDVSIGTAEVILRDDDGERLIKDVEPQAKRRGWFGGWKGTLYLGSGTSAIVLILNLAMVLWASLRKSDKAQNILYSGNCDRSKQIGTGVHLLINVLSTLLPSASNFGTQCLSAPTRQDVDLAHAERKWLDIGVSSVRNLWSIPRSRLVLWLCLVSTSAPLHLFYNSTVYSTISANEYTVYVANHSFTSLAPSDVHRIPAYGYGDFQPEVSTRLIQVKDKLEKLGPDDCISAYPTSFMNKYGSVVLISADYNATRVGSPLAWFDSPEVPTAARYTAQDPWEWICEKVGYPAPGVDPWCSTEIDAVRSTIPTSGWVVKDHRVDHCLAEPTPQKCTLEFSLPLAVIVIVANIAKALLMGATARPEKMTAARGMLTRQVYRARDRQNARARLGLRAGKAVASFLFRLGEMGVPIDVPSRFYTEVYSKPPQQVNEHEPLPYSETPSKRWSALSKARWATCLITYLISVLAAVTLLTLGILTTSVGQAQALFTAGFAETSTKTMVSGRNWPTDLISNVLIANVPQLVFSVLYFMSNGILTNMTLAPEWNTFSLERKGLRVSTRPKGEPRGTHFLSLPWRFGIPLIALSSLLHWLMSQSLYLVRIIAYSEAQERAPGKDTMTLGYSPKAIVIGLCVGLCLPTGLVVLGLRRFKSGMPVAGSCSLAISAACHPLPTKDIDGSAMEIGTEKVMWGVQTDAGEEIGQGRCAFSDGEVGVPVDGRVYL